MERKRLLTIGQAAKVLGIPASTLRVHADKGGVPTVRLPDSKYRRFDPDVIERIAREWRGEEPAEPAGGEGTR